MSTTDEVRERFEWDAKDFDAIYRASGSRLGYWANRILRKAVFERYRITFEESGNVQGKAVLDIGCGSGIYAAEFVRRGVARVVGVDFSEPMLELARREAASHGAADRCKFVKADFRDANLDEHFDVAIAMGVFDYLPDPEPFLKKMAKAATHVLASFPAPSGVRGIARRMRYRLTGRGDVYYYTEARLHELAKRAAFDAYELVPIRAPYSGSGWVLSGKSKPR